MLEAEPTGQHDHTRNGGNGNKAFTDAASKAYATWLHRAYRTAIGRGHIQPYNTGTSFALENTKHDRLCTLTK